MLLNDTHFNFWEDGYYYQALEYRAYHRPDTLGYHAPLMSVLIWILYLCLYGFIGQVSLFVVER